MDDFDDEWDDNVFPLAYLITIRTYGTWLHGDERTSTDVHDRYNLYGGEKRPPNEKLLQRMSKNMNSVAVRLSEDQRIVVAGAIREVCEYREYILHALNVRMTHAHVVVSAQENPEKIANSFKSYATRELLLQGLITKDIKPWARGRSRRYLWKDKDLLGAIHYVKYCQGDESFAEWFAEHSKPDKKA